MQKTPDIVGGLCFCSVDCLLLLLRSLLGGLLLRRSLFGGLLGGRLFRSGYRTLRWTALAAATCSTLAFLRFQIAFAHCLEC